MVQVHTYVNVEIWRQTQSYNTEPHITILRNILQCTMVKGSDKCGLPAIMHEGRNTLFIQVSYNQC